MPCPNEEQNDERVVFAVPGSGTGVPVLGDLGVAMCLFASVGITSNLELRTMKYLCKILLSLGCSALIVGLLFGLSGAAGKDVSPATVVSAVKGALAVFVVVYVVCQVLQTLFRAIRARMLLAASMPDGGNVPGLFHMMLVTFVRGACADMLPARIGELSYVAMLNKGCSVPAPDCLSSLSIGLLFDFVALLAVLAVAVPAATQGLSLVGSLIMLAIICIVGSACLFIVFPVIAGKLGKLYNTRFFKCKPMAALLRLITDTADSVVKTRKAGVALRVVLYSICVRLAKYAGLYCLFVAITRPLWPDLSHAGVFSVLIALIAAEGAASLPVPTFMSFGSYEAGGLAALTALGFPAADSMSAMIAMHVLSQIIDYGIGGAAFLVFTWFVRPASAEVVTQRHSTSRKIAIVIMSLGILGFLLLFAAVQYRASVKRGRVSLPPAGEATRPTPEELDIQRRGIEGFRGKIVWSSNRSGIHDIYLLNLPSMKMERVTSSGFTDTYPRFSPDGRKIAFSRSREQWVSQRNWSNWDTWVVDLASGREVRVATNAYMAVWSPDGASLIYMRDGGKAIAKMSADGIGREDVLLAVPTANLPEGTLVSIPDVRDGDPWLAATLRGKMKNTAFIFADGSVSNVSQGCQLVWRGTGTGHAWIGRPGKQKNAIFAGASGCGAGVLFDGNGRYSHEYFPSFTKDGRWIVFGASTGGHEQDSEDYEIFLLDTVRKDAPPARLTFHTGNDCWPDIFEE